jgi:hypothetical protein
VGLGWTLHSRADRLGPLSKTKLLIAAAREMPPQQPEPGRLVHPPLHVVYISEEEYVSICFTDLPNHIKIAIWVV